MSQKHEAAPAKPKGPFKRKVRIGSASSWDNFHLNQFRVDFDEDTEVQESDYPWLDYCYEPETSEDQFDSGKTPSCH